MFKQDFHYIERKSEINEEVDYMRETVTFSLSRSLNNMVQSLFIQNSIVVDLKGDPLSQSKSEIFDMMALKFSPLYNYQNVIKNSWVALETREDLRRGGERTSHKHLSYFNLTLSTSMERNPMNSSIKTSSDFKRVISRIKRDKNAGSELIIYNIFKNSWKTVMLDNFRSMKNPCLHHIIGDKSGYCFVYDNQGIIHVLFNDLKICELILPDERINPSIFVYEKNSDQSILLVAGGYVMKGSNVAIMETCAVFFLNFRELSKLLKHEPIFFIKMKYPRMNPTIFKHKTETETIFIFMAGNDLEKIQSHQKDATRKSLLGLFDGGNMFCETISFKRIRDNIYKSDFNKMSNIITTEDTLLMILNGHPGDEINQMEKLRFSMDEGAVLRFRARKNGKKTSFFVGAGKKKTEIWLIDKVDLVEHKLYLIKSPHCLKSNKNSVFCKAMIALSGEDLFYFHKEDSKELKFKKQHIKGQHGIEFGKGGCEIF